MAGLKPFKKLGVLGGTFDPPHIAHFILASEALDQYKLDVVLWVLTPNPPHKKDQDITDVKSRHAMLFGALSEDENFVLSTVDLDRDPPHYAVDTMALLQNRYPGSELYYIMGTDSLVQLHTWHEPQRFVSLCKGILVLPREGVFVDLQQINQKLPGISGKVNFIKSPCIGISSSQIRDRVRLGKPFRYFVPPEVYRVIVDNGLYGFNQDK